MAQIKVGRQSIDTKNIAMIADTYAIVNQHGKDASSFVLTHEPASDFAQKVIAADPSVALVSTGAKGRGNFLNIDYIKDVQNHSVEMNFGTKEVDAKVPTELTKDDMQRQMNRVSDFVLQGTVEHDKASRFDLSSARERISKFLNPGDTKSQADRSPMSSSEAPVRSDVARTTLRGFQYENDPEMNKPVNAPLDKWNKVEVVVDSKGSSLDPAKLRFPESSRRLPDVPTGGSEVDNSMDFGS